MIKISECLFWLQSMLFKSCFNDVADFLGKEGGDVRSPRFAILITLLLPHIAKKSHCRYTSPLNSQRTVGINP